MFSLHACFIVCINAKQQLHLSGCAVTQSNSHFIICLQKTQNCSYILCNYQTNFGEKNVALRGIFPFSGLEANKLHFDANTVVVFNKITQGSNKVVEGIAWLTENKTFRKDRGALVVQDGSKTEFVPVIVL